MANEQSNRAELVQEEEKAKELLGRTELSASEKRHILNQFKNEAREIIDRSPEGYIGIIDPQRGSVLEAEIPIDLDPLVEPKPGIYYGSGREIKAVPKGDDKLYEGGYQRVRGRLEEVLSTIESHERRKIINRVLSGQTEVKIRDKEQEKNDAVRNLSYTVRDLESEFSNIPNQPEYRASLGRDKYVVECTLERKVEAQEEPPEETHEGTGKGWILGAAGSIVAVAGIFGYGLGDHFAKTDKPTSETDRVAIADSTRASVEDSLYNVYSNELNSLRNTADSTSTVNSRLNTSLERAKAMPKRQEATLNLYEAQIRELNRNHQEAQRSVRAYQENLLATSTSRIENLREVVGMSLTGYADSARVMNNILSGNTINMFGGEEAQRHDPRADNPNDAWVFERNAEGKPKGFGYRIGERR